VGIGYASTPRKRKRAGSEDGGVTAPAAPGQRGTGQAMVTSKVRLIYKQSSSSIEEVSRRLNDQTSKTETGRTGNQVTNHRP